jgi:aspartokinase/homoserine dehydrogenase 1
VRGISGSTRMILAESAIDLAQWPQLLAERGERADLEKFAAHCQADYIPHTVLIDCTASSEVAAHYRDWLARGIHVVTPNKKANSGSLPSYRALKDAARAAGTHYLYEATVGAGLPVIQTLRDLRETGDEITRIEGIFSGTLAYLFNVFDGSESFSSIVRIAKQKGYTEPDPRDDLSGMDVARKLIILAREMGLTLEMSDVQVTGLVPAALDGCGVEEFMDRLSEFDAGMEAMLHETKRAGQVLRYVGRVDADGTATVGLTRLDAKHAFANIALTDNVVRYATRRYCDNPLIVQGPGAGPEVTAGGVFSDLLRLSAYLGAHI